MIESLYYAQTLSLRSRVTKREEHNTSSTTSGPPFLPEQEPFCRFTTFPLVGESPLRFAGEGRAFECQCVPYTLQLTIMSVPLDIFVDL